jgi:hypothetical protein
VILSDVRPGPLEKARANLSRSLPGAVFDIRLGDGLAPYARGEVDVAVIAGMGGLRIADILSADAEKARSFGMYILQPRSAADKLRVRLSALGFEIRDEALAAEGDFICEIICAAPRALACEPPAPDAAETAEDDPVTPARLRRAEKILTAGGLRDEISPLLFRGPDPLLAAWLARKIKAADAVSARLSDAGAGKEALLAASCARAASLRALLDTFRPPADA